MIINDPFDLLDTVDRKCRAIEVEMDKGLFVSRAEAESTTLKDLLERYVAEFTPLGSVNILSHFASGGGSGCLSCC